MRAVVEGLDLMAAGPGGREALRPEDVVSPVQQRLYQLVGRKALDQGYKVGGQGGRGARVCACVCVCVYVAGLFPGGFSGRLDVEPRLPSRRPSAGPTAQIWPLTSALEWASHPLSAAATAQPGRGIESSQHTTITSSPKIALMHPPVPQGRGRGADVSGVRPPSGAVSRQGARRAGEAAEALQNAGLPGGRRRFFHCVWGDLARRFRSSRTSIPLKRLLAPPSCVAWRCRHPGRSRRAWTPRRRLLPQRRRARRQRGPAVRGRRVCCGWGRVARG
jgi:hypothetical protein